MKKLRILLVTVALVGTFLVPSGTASATTLTLDPVQPVLVSTFTAPKHPIPLTP